MAYVNPLISLVGFALYAIYWAVPLSGPQTLPKADRTETAFAGNLTPK